MYRQDCPLAAVLFDWFIIYVNFYPEIITTKIVNVLIICVLRPWGDL